MLERGLAKCGSVDSVHRLSIGRLLRDSGSEYSDGGVRGGVVLGLLGHRVLAVPRRDDIHVERGVVLGMHARELPAVVRRQQLFELRGGYAASEHGSDKLHGLSFW